MFKNILQLITGNGFAQLIQFVSLPVLTKFYSPGDFGHFALVIAISGILAVVSSLQFHVAIVSLKSRYIVKRLISSGFLLNLLMILVSLLLAILANIIFYNGTLSNSFIVLVICITFLSSMNNLLKGFFVYSGSFTIISKLLIVRAVIIVSLQFLFAVINVSYGLIFGLLIGECALFLLMSLGGLIGKSKFLFYHSPLKNFKNLVFFIKKLKDFVLYGTPQEIVSIMIFWMPLIIITSLFGDSISGQYSISARILWPATTLISSSVAQVIYHRMVNIENKFISEQFIFCTKLKLIYIPIIFSAYYVTPYLFKFILDDGWDIAINLSKYVAILCAIFLYVLPYRVLFRVVQKQRVLLLLESFFLISLISIASVLEFKDVESLLMLIIFLSAFQAILIEMMARFILREYKFNVSL